MSNVGAGAVLFISQQCGPFHTLDIHCVAASKTDLRTSSAQCDLKILHRAHSRPLERCQLLEVEAGTGDRS